VAFQLGDNVLSGADLALLHQGHQASGNFLGGLLFIAG